jgi:hypothetical protein
MSSRACERASGKATAGGVFPEEEERLVGLGHDLGLAAAEPAGFDLLLVRQAVGRRLVEPLGAFMHLALHLQHLDQAGFERDKHLLDFLFAKLPQDVFELRLGLLELADRLFLLAGGSLPLGLFEFRPCFLHAAPSLLQPLASRVAIARLRRVGGLLAAVVPGLA